MWSGPTSPLTRNGGAASTPSSPHRTPLEGPARQCRSGTGKGLLQRPGGGLGTGDRQVVKTRQQRLDPGTTDRHSNRCSRHPPSIPVGAPMISETHTRPRSVSRADVNRVLASVDSRTEAGRRDYAIFKRDYAIFKLAGHQSRHTSAKPERPPTSSPRWAAK